MKKFIIILLSVISPVVLKAQEENKGVSFNVQGDLVSSYIWRGMYQSGAAVQPTLGLQVAGFSLTAWGSVDFTGQGHKEADITAAYTIAGVTISVADLGMAGQSGIYNDRETVKITISILIITLQIIFLKRDCPMRFRLRNFR